jgi:hypothetical protein
MASSVHNALCWEILSLCFVTLQDAEGSQNMIGISKCLYFVTRKQNWAEAKMKILTYNRNLQLRNLMRVYRFLRLFQEITGIFNFVFLHRMYEYIKSVPDFYILLTVHPEAIVGFQPTWRTYFTVFRYLFFHLYMFQATSAHHQEGTIVSTHPLV